MTSLLFVCAGNTCRSPMAVMVATALARRGTGKAGSWSRIESAGTACRRPGAPMDPRAVATLRARGYVTGDHAARPTATIENEQYDLVLAMDHSTLSAVRRQLHPKARPEAELLLRAAGVDGIDEVSDPYHGDADDYRQALDLIERALRMLAES